MNRHPLAFIVFGFNCCLHLSTNVRYIHSSWNNSWKHCFSPIPQQRKKSGNTYRLFDVCIQPQAFDHAQTFPWQLFLTIYPRHNVYPSILLSVSYSWILLVKQWGRSAIGVVFPLKTLVCPTCNAISENCLRYKPIFEQNLLVVFKFSLQFNFFKAVTLF